MSPRAAARLEQLGFTEVYDYEAGKADWLAFCLPAEGKGEPTIGDIVLGGVPTCGPEETIATVRSLFGEGWEWILVVNPAGVILGRLRRDRLGDDPGARAGEVMELGPSTYRPSVPLSVILARMRKGGWELGIVSDSTGRPFGLFKRADAESRLEEWRAGNN